MTSKTIRISADSVCDLPDEIVSALDIKIIPTYVNIADKSYADGVDLNREDYYRMLPDLPAQPTTAAPSPGDAESFFRSILDSGADHVISFHVPEKLSGTFNAMRLGAQAVDADKITIVDSLQLSFGIGMQVWVAAELAQQTDDVDEILRAVERVRQNTQVYAVFATIEYLKRSGRVNALLAGIGTLLKIKPIIRVWDGDILSFARVRTWKNAIEKLRELTHAETPLDRLAILHIANHEGAEEFLETIRDIAPENTVIIEVTPTLGTHIGPGSLGVATLSKNWRQ